MTTDTQNEERTPQPTPYACQTCKDQGWWIDDEAQKRDEEFFFWCSCPTGVRVRFEDEGGD